MKTNELSQPTPDGTGHTPPIGARKSCPLISDGGASASCVEALEARAGSGVWLLGFDLGFRVCKKDCPSSHKLCMLRTRVLGPFGARDA